MKARINRTRKGKKIVKAPESISLYHEEGESLHYAGVVGFDKYTTTVRVIPNDLLKVEVQIDGTWYNVKDLI